MPRPQAGVPGESRAPCGPKSILLFDAGGDSGPLAVELQEKGWPVGIGSANKKMLEQLQTSPVSAVLIRYRAGEIPDKFLRTDLKDYIQKGGLVIISADAEIPVQDWFSGLPPVKWTGPKKAIFRKAAFVMPGDWQKYPNDLQQQLTRGTTPLTGFIPALGGWEILAEIPTANNGKAPFLLLKQMGKGALVLTSAPMGYGGGFDMLGNRNTLNVVKLIENLQAKTNKR